MEKVRIVEESFRGHRQGSMIAGRYGISRSLLTRWRKEYRLGLFGSAPSAFTPLQITSGPGPTASTPNETPTVEDKVEITLANGRRLSVVATIDGTVLSCLLRVLERT